MTFWDVVLVRQMSAERFSQFLQKPGRMCSKQSAWGASMGGDTDTIAALAGALCAAFAGRHNIPAEIQNMVLETNHLDLEQLSQSVSVRHITSL